jgi:hypothetical protein
VYSTTCVDFSLNDTLQNKDKVAGRSADLESSGLGINYVPSPSVLSTYTTMPGGIDLGNRIDEEPDSLGIRDQNGSTSSHRGMDDSGLHPNPTIEACEPGNRLPNVGQASEPVRPVC